MSSRVLFLGAALSIAVALVAPLWFTDMEAPQYKGEEALHVRVYASEIVGDLDEIGLLNEYVGAKLPTDLYELQVMPWVLGVLVTLALLAGVLPAPRSRWPARLTVSLLAASALAGIWSLQHRLHEIGHERENPIFASIEDFSPPLMGTARVANFTVTTGLMGGGWSLVGGGILALAGLIVLESAGRAERKRQGEARAGNTTLRGDEVEAESAGLAG